LLKFFKEIIYIHSEKKHTQGLHKFCFSPSNTTVNEQRGIRDDWQVASMREREFIQQCDREVRREEGKRSEGNKPVGRFMSTQI
jgi:hypothetical protein